MSELTLSEALHVAIMALTEKIETLNVAVTMVEGRGEENCPELAVRDYSRRKRLAEAVSVLKRERYKIENY